MPNIEVWGFNAIGTGQIVKTSPDNGDVSQEIRDKIFEIFHAWHFDDKLIVTIVYSDVADVFGFPKPFLRVWDTDIALAEKIARQLRLNGFDVELPMRLARFLPAPLYSIDEIQEELKLVTRTRNVYEEVVALLSNGHLRDACAFFEGQIRASPYCTLEPPTAEELKRKHEPASLDDFTQDALRINFIRWHQMLAILSD
jgi:hypothetical protein